MYSDTINYLLTKKGQFVSFNTSRDMNVGQWNKPYELV